MDAPKPAQERDEAADADTDGPGSRVLSDPTRDDPDREARWAKWREENAGAIDAMNRWYEKNGHPLAKYMILPDGAV